MDETKTVHRSHSILLKERKNLQITGVTEILRFDENCIALDISDSQLNIEGTGLKIESFSHENGEVSVSGYVDSILYVGKTPDSYRRGILKRIFSYDQS